MITICNLKTLGTATIIFCLLNVPGCIETETINETYGQNEILWICHNPGTEFHDKICTHQPYPNGCYIPGDGSAFCWELTPDMCKEIDITPSIASICNYYSVK